MSHEFNPLRLCFMLVDNKAKPSAISASVIPQDLRIFRWLACSVAPSAKIKRPFGVIRSLAKTIPSVRSSTKMRINFYPCAWLSVLLEISVVRVG